jgi:hypothetical protein
MILCLIFIFGYLLYDVILEETQEAFTPSINGFYRPYARKTRHSIEHFVSSHYSNMETFLKKHKIL